MSYGPHATNSYTNGRYSEDDQDTQPISGRRVRRAGGYGGFFNSDLAEQPESDNTQKSGSPDQFNAPGIPAWRRRDGSSSRDRSGQNGNATRLYGDGPGARQIEG